MTSIELRKSFLDFFEKRGHKIVPSSLLIPTDPSVLFTTAGMQQFKEYYLGKESPYGKNVASCQKCFRTSDIEEVGNEKNLTFFEMLGNFSFGGYGKREAIIIAKDFLDSINIKIDYVTVFKGDKEIPRDEGSVKIWRELGFSEEKGNLKFCGREDNFWGPTGLEGPCGPNTEIYSQNIEIWNLVFNQFYCQRDKSLKELPLFGVDTGMGLERITKVSQDVPTVYETDLFLPIIKEIRDRRGTGEGQSLKAERIIVDHIKGAVFLVSEGILPSNVEKGYVLRRILRRAIRYGKLLNQVKQFLIPLAQKVIEIYQDVYPEMKLKETDILTVIQNEEEKFEKSLEKGLKELKSQIADCKFKKIDILAGKIVFDLYQSYGFPLELTEELAKEQGFEIDKKGFEEDFKKHQELSRTASAGMFKSGLAETSEQAIKYHTATHLLHQALREVLGSQVVQKGSNITSERLRFDFSHSRKMTNQEIKRVEEIVNEKIKENLPVIYREMILEEAKKIGALGLFEEKYGEKVRVYSINDFSREICAGPHVGSTAELGYFKIIKEESVSAGVRRIKAILN